ncbi:MAG TPA: serine/threonine-protein kinase [Streptomyces sp.]|nr:serine/threonine-protein kinase [Streptomyces sp.]
MLLADRYRLDELLGRGSVGEVWRAADQTLSRPVAVKLLRTDEATDVERFRMEALTTARLNHPHVVSVYDFGSDQGQLYLVMECIDGWSLAQERSLRGVLPPDEAAALAAQVAVGLSAAHRHGVIHRDIKPANVMLTADRTAKITDFGIARFADEADCSLTATGKIVGTADYLAPERALGRSAQPAADVYSLGCVLYHLLTGQVPFQGATSLAVVRQHVTAVPVPPARLRPEIPRQLSDYVLRLLAKNPAHRPAAAEVADWLGAAAWTDPDSAARPAPRPVTVPADPAGAESAPLPPAAAPVVTPAAALHPDGRPSRRRAYLRAYSRARSRGVPASRAALGSAAVVLFAGATAVVGAPTAPSPGSGPGLGAGSGSGSGDESRVPAEPSPVNPTGPTGPTGSTPSTGAASSAAPDAIPGGTRPSVVR